MTNKIIAKFVENSVNRKLSNRQNGKVSSTYVSIKTSCPSTCQFRDGTCYAASGPIAVQLKLLDNNSKYYTPDTAAVQEAQLIESSFNGGSIPQDGAKGGRDLRIHGFGDARTSRAAKRLGKAATNWRSRKGGSVWTYTHAWKNVSRSIWGSDISVLASIDKMSDVQTAKQQGFAPAIVVPKFENGSKAWESNGIKWIPCPAQINSEITCTKCRLCMKDEFLNKNNLGIAFEAHGSGKNKIKKRLLNVIY